MNRYGRASLVVILGVVALLACVVVVLISGRESLGSVGARFMEALSKGDVNTLTDMTYAGVESQDQIRGQWTEAVGVSKYYNFTWKVLGADQSDPKSGAVRLSVVRDATNPGGYEQNYQLPLVRVGNEWKVDIRDVSRELYPDLPH